MPLAQREVKAFQLEIRDRNKLRNCLQRTVPKWHLMFNPLISLWECLGTAQLRPLQWPLWGGLVDVAFLFAGNRLSLGYYWLLLWYFIPTPYKGCQGSAILIRRECRFASAAGLVIAVDSSEIKQSRKTSGQTLSLSFWMCSSGKANQGLLCLWQGNKRCTAGSVRRTRRVPSLG